MMLWFLSLAAGLALAALSYRWPARGLPRVGFGLRALTGTLVAAVVLNAPMGAPRPAAPWVAVDVSASWLAAGGEARWAAVVRTVDSLRNAGADSVVLFGADFRGGELPPRPADTLSLAGPLVEAARALGRPVVIITDGRLDDAERLSELPEGSAVVVVPGEEPEDAGIAALDVPPSVVAGDSLELRVMLRAGARGSSGGHARWSLGGRALATLPYTPLPPFGERELRLSVLAPAVEGTPTIEAILEPGDAVPQNDTARASVEISGVATAVVISTSPDQDARFALDVLRGTRRGAVRGYWRVAPGQWRADGTLRPVDEKAVRRAFAEASLVVLHGDTNYFGPPRARTRGTLVLLAPPGGTQDFYVMAAGDSPLLAALADLPWDSLPPLRVGLRSTDGGYRALLARRARRLEERAVVVLDDGARRTVIVQASGLWRWRTRGGRSAQAFDAVWGSIFDWVGTERRAGSAGTAGAQINGEWLPGAPTAASGRIGTGAALDLAPRARAAWFFWLIAIALVALCVEWVIRRRIGWR